MYFSQCHVFYRKLKKIVAILTATTCISQPALVFAAPPADQLPTGGQIVAGQANISQNGANMNITQTSDRAAINWQSFDIGGNAHVNFDQPTSNSVALNRVMNGNPSQIFGKLTANGRVFLTNSAGVYFAPGASVNVGALVATTHGISDDDFMDGKYTFSRNGAEGTIKNEGTIQAGLGGYIALLAPQVQNEGVIIAQMGTVAMAAGETFALHFDGQNKLSDITVTKSSIDALVENKQAVLAPGGLIILSAQAVNSLQGGVVKNSGTVEASGFVNDGGVIKIVASDKIELDGSIKADAKAGSSGKGGTVLAIASLENHDSMMEFTGTISARGGEEGGDGGFIETSGSYVNVSDTARVDTQAPEGKTGKWLIDPFDYTIDGTAASNIVTALSTSNVEVATSASVGGHGATGAGTGTINVTSGITSASLNTLTLTADSTITIGAAISVGALELNGPGGISLNNSLTTVTDMTLNGNVSLGADVTLTSGISNTYTSYQDYTVAAGVTSLTAKLVGGVGGKGGDDGGTGGSGTNVGSLTASFAVTPGQHLYIAPGAGGSNGTTGGGAAGAAGGTNQFGLGSGGAGGATGPSGFSGSGAGGGAATIIALVSNPNASSAMLVAGGGGGGGGAGNNASCPSQCADQTAANYQASSMNGQPGYNYNASNPSSGLTDGGGSGGGGGGLLGGLSNYPIAQNEWVGRGANAGSSGAANSFSTTSLSTSILTGSTGAGGYAIISYGGGDIVINGTVNGGRNLTISSPNNNVNITGAVGGSTALTSLIINGSQGISLSGGGVTTTGTQTYNGPVTLNANNNVFTTTNSALTFAGNVLKGSGVTSNLTTSSGSGAVYLNGNTGTSGSAIGAVNITTTGTTSIGGTLYATSLTKSGTGKTTVSGGLIQTSGAQSYADIFDLGGNTTLTSTGSGDITLSKALSNSNQSNLTINAASGSVSIVGNLANGTNALPTPIGDISVTASGTFTLGTSGTPINAQAKSLSVTAGTATIYASTNTFNTTDGNLSAVGINLTNSASFNVSNASTITGPFSGAMTFTKSGAGKLTASGVNTFTGNTTINAGVLEIGGSGRLGNGNYNGNVAIGSTGQLRFNTSANNTLGGTFSGAGFANTVGAGTTQITTLSNQNYYNLITAYIVPIGTGSNASTYGNSPTNLTYQLQTAAGGGSIITDASPSGTAVFSGAPTSTSNAGNYTIGYSSGITLGSERYPNLQIGNNINWVVNPRALTLTVSKVYDGNANFSSGIALSGTVNGDAAPTITGGSASVSSINAGSYNSFAASTLTQSNSNYTLTGATISAAITAKPLNLTVSKVYNGSTLFSSGFAVTGMVGSESAPTVSGNANTASTNVGTYTSFASSTLSLSNANYTLSGGSVSAVINAKPLNLTVSKVYDGNTLFSGDFDLSGMVSGDTEPTVSGSANSASANAGDYTSFASNTLSLSNTNYTLSGGTIDATIEKRALNLVVIKGYDGGTQFTSGFSLTGMVSGEAAPGVSGAADVLSPTAGTYTNFANNGLILSNANYTLTGGTVSATINPKPPVVSEVTPKKPETVVIAQPDQKQIDIKLPDYNNVGNKVEVTTTVAEPQPNKTETTTITPAPAKNANTPADAPANSNGITVSLVRAPSDQSSGVISVVVPKENMAKSNGFSFALPEQVGVQNVAISAKMENGSPLPGWIKFNPENNTFVAANVPAGGLPLTVLVSVGGKSSTIVISEQSGQN